MKAPAIMTSTFFAAFARNVDQDAHDSKVSIFASSGLIRFSMTGLPCTVARCSPYRMDQLFCVPASAKGNLLLFHTIQEALGACLMGHWKLLAPHHRALGEFRSPTVEMGFPRHPVENGCANGVEGKTDGPNDHGVKWIFDSWRACQGATLTDDARSYAGS